jgi:hypothetical protein
MDIIVNMIGTNTMVNKASSRVERKGLEILDKSRIVDNMKDSLCTIALIDVIVMILFFLNRRMLRERSCDTR